MRQPFIGLSLMVIFTAALALRFHVPLAAQTNTAAGIKLSASTASYSYSDGLVFSEGGRLGPERELETELVKRVALFKLWLERDPFFLSPATGLGGFAQSAERLAELERLMTGGLTPPEKLWPSAFLKAYADASSAFDSFSSSPSEQGAALVLDRLEAGVSDYALSVPEISKAVLKHFDRLNTKKLSTRHGANFTDRNVLARDFSLIEKNAAAAAARLNELKNCLTVSSSYCRPDWPAAPSSPARRGRAAPDPLKLSELGLENRPGISGPYLVATPCWNGFQTNYLYYQEQCREGKPCRDWNYLASDLSFRKLEATNPRDINLREKKLLGKVEVVPVSSIYYCAHIGYPMVLRALSLFADNYSGTPAYQDPQGTGPAAKAAAAAAAAEKAFAGEKIKSQQALDRLGAVYLELLKSLSASGLPYPAELLARARLINLRTAGLGLTFNRVESHLRNYSRVFRGQEPLPPLIYDTLFASRNYYGLMFMPFTPTVWRIPEPLEYVGGSLPDTEKAVIGYRQAVKLYGREEVERAVRFFSTGGERGPREEGTYGGGAGAPRETTTGERQ